MKRNEAKKLKRKEAKRSEKLLFFVSQNEAKRKRNGFCFASFRFEAKKKYKRKWDTLIQWQKKTAFAFTDMDLKRQKILFAMIFQLF